MSEFLTLKGLVYRVVATGLPFLSALRQGHSGSSVGIIMIHGVYPKDEIGGVPTPQSSVVLRTLEANLLNVKSYSFITLREAAQMIKGNSPFRKRCLVVTFDDSLKSHIEVIAPKLIHWGIPATFYISTEVIETRHPYWWLRLEYAISKLKEIPVTVTLPNGEKVTIHSEKKWEYRRKISVALHSSCTPVQCEQVVEAVESQIGISWKDLNSACPYIEPMSWDDVRELSLKGFNIGSHTCSHPNLTLLDSNNLRSELERSKQILEQHSGKPCYDLSYPHGYHSEAVCKAAEVAGYSTAVTTQHPGWNGRTNDPLRLGRFSIPKLPYKLAFELSGIKGLLNHLNARQIQTNDDYYTRSWRKNNDFQARE